MSTDELQVGQYVELSDGRPATVRFIGPTDFAPTGIWIGVELEDYSGKNDGSVKGERYFDCEQARGMFVRIAAISIIDPPAAMAPPPRPGLVGRKGARPSSVVPAAIKRMSAVPDSSAVRRQSMNTASPSPAPKRSTSMLRSPTKSPTKQLLSGPSSISSTPRTGTPSNVRAPSVTRPTSLTAKRTTMGPPAVPAFRPPRQSLVSRAGPPPRIAAPSRLTNRSSMGRLTSQSSQASLRATSESSFHDGSGNRTPGDDKLLSPELSDESMHSPSSKPTSPSLNRASMADLKSPSSSSSVRNITSPAALKAALVKEVDDLKAKLRVMEKKRMEDREKLKCLEHAKMERDKFEGIIQKIQAKYQPQQQEITDLRKQLKEATARFDEVENMQAEHDDALEMAALDREMAEENAEVLRTELDALKGKTEELELEVEVLREENEELGGEMSTEEKTSQGWLQMERNNERLREALLRLRDLTQQTESELRDEIKNLEQDNRELSSVKDHYEVVRGKLAHSEASIEDLRQQLDNALGAEDMIEELTERNMSMNEQIDELKATIEDLESLKELNDELEINHVETEKDMQEDIDFKDALINEQARRLAEQNESLDDMEYTLSRFRELVTNLQTDLEDMRASHAVTESESEQLSSRSRAMMDLNFKLQVSAAKTQVKTIDLELRKLEAQEASDHLAIVQLFLPEAFLAERDSVLALLRFKRVAFKANLLQGFVRERASGQANHEHEDDMFTACDVSDKLAWVSAMCERFVNAISHCSVEEFAKFEGAMYELEPVERALNGWIDALRRDELKVQQCAIELQRTISLMSHLAELHISDGLESFAENIHMRTSLMQTYLEHAASALAATKVMVLHTMPNKEENDELEQHFSKKMESIISATRSAKVIVGKAVRSLEELKSRSLSLLPETMNQFEQCEGDTKELAKFARQAGSDLFAVIHEQDRAEALTYHNVDSSIITSSNSVFGAGESDAFSTFAIKLRSLTTSLSDLASLTTDLSQTQEFERSTAPWILRSQELKSSKTVSVDTTEELSRLKDENRERLRTIALRDQTLEESTVKIELLESRMRDANKKNEKIAELERKISEARQKESQLAQTIESRDRELLASEQEKERFKKLANEQKVVELEPGTKAGLEKAVATAREMQSLKNEIEALQAAVLYLREDNRLTKFSEPRGTTWLEQPLLKKKSPQQAQKERIVREGNDVLIELLGLCGEAEVFDLSTMPENRLAWRPAKKTPAYHVAKQREDWALWRSWSGDVLKKGDVLKPKDVKVGFKKKGEFAARVKLSWPELEGKGFGGGHLHIVEPGEFDEFRRRLSIV